MKSKRDWSDAMEATAKAMWDSKTANDGSPRWDDLDPVMDAQLKKEIVEMAKAGVTAYKNFHRPND